MMFHCLFEQSGAFKNEFIKLGYKAKDYDIKNEYGQTDVQCDLFEEIEKEYKGQASIFSKMVPGEYVLAFFPCTYFAAYNSLIFTGKQPRMKTWDIERKLEYLIERHNKLNESYKMICELVVVCVKRQLKLIIENPARQSHYLNMFWCFEPSIVDYNRTKKGDKFEKPTQYWFINCNPKENYVEYNSKDKTEIEYIHKTNGKARSRKRSEISSEYANTFIREYILSDS